MPRAARTFFAPIAPPAIPSPAAADTSDPISRASASARSPSALAAKIRTPNRNILAGFQPVTVVLADGKRIRGTRKNEDAFSIQIMDTGERLQGFRKADVQEIIREPRP